VRVLRLRRVLADAVVGIEAAHGRWFNFDGPDDPDKGLALCSLHHKLFDRGALGLSAAYRVQVSEAFRAIGADRAVYELQDRELRPRPGTVLPAEVHIAWHRTQVFRPGEVTARVLTELPAAVDAAETSVVPLR
jgi:putative restriction endonuclease